MRAGRCNGVRERGDSGSVETLEILPRFFQGAFGLVDGLCGALGFGRHTSSLLTCGIGGSHDFLDTLLRFAFVFLSFLRSGRGFLELGLGMFGRLARVAHRALGRLHPRSCREALRLPLFLQPAPSLVGIDAAKRLVFARPASWAACARRNRSPAVMSRSNARRWRQ